MNKVNMVYGYVHNCYLVMRDGERSPYGEQHMFVQDEKGIKATLNGYAIIPVEQYEELIARTSSAASV